ncbi:Hypothetical protein AA314_03290 [Archangium gephyra]|uniref:Uncharacterized protein n=1 Tax=Archangium gephyra TaxID=48 RepID=A0AAC8Q661_9BACT|nr:Hypothetical protein AA314_03290 [Archangium gephyra]
MLHAFSPSRDTAHHRGRSSTPPGACVAWRSHSASVRRGPPPLTLCFP